MHRHSVTTRVKNNALLAKADARFDNILGVQGGERCLALIKHFIGMSKIFADEQYASATTTVTIHFKELKIIEGAREGRPLSLVRINDGVALMLCRPDPAKPEGLLFKLCPHDRVGMTIEEQYLLEIARFNRSLPDSLLGQAQLALAS